MTAELMEYHGTGTVTWTFETEDGWRIMVEEYEDAHGARVVAGAKYASEEIIEEISERLFMPVDWEP